MPTIDIRRAEFSRILIIKPSAVGDVVHALPVLEKLRRRYPRARIDWLLTPENAEMVRGHPALTNILLFNRREFTNGRPVGAVSRVLRLIGEIRAARYEMVIDLHGQFRSALFAVASEAPVRIGFGSPIRKRTASTFQGRQLANIPDRGWTGAREGSWFAYSHRIPIPTLEVHAVDRYLWVGGLLGFDNEPPEFNLPVSPEAEERIGRHLAEHAAPGRPLAILSPATTWETKHWTTDGYAAVARRLVENGYAPVLIGAKGEEALNRFIRERAPGASDFTGQTSLPDVVALIRRAAVVITNDSGAMHIAAALNRPMVCIFGPTNPVHVGPYGHPEAVIRLDIPCSPCNYRRLSQCPNEHRCMRELTADMVFERVQAALAAARAPHLTKC